MRLAHETEPALAWAGCFIATSGKFQGGSPMADNDRWRNQERGPNRSREDQHGRAEGRYEDWGGRADRGRFTGEGDRGRFTGEGGGSRGGEGRYAEQGRYEDFGGRPDRGRFTGEGGSHRGGSRGGTEGYGYGGGYGRGEDRDQYGGADRGGYGSGGGREGGGFGGDYYSGFYGADQEHGRDRSEDRGRTSGGSSGYGRSGDQRGYLDTPQGGEWRRYADRGGGRESYGREGYGDQDRGRTGERGFFERMGDQVASWFGSDDPARHRGQGGPQAQHHRGRGPKGYSRSDERIREDVSDRLTDDPYIDASEIEVSVSNREVTLSGSVDSREARRRAEDIAESVGGVTHVQNNLRVGQGTSGGTASTMGLGTTGGATGTGGGGAASGGTTGAGSQSAASQGVTMPPMGESITAMNSSDANRIAQGSFGPSGDTTGTGSDRK
jgi:osmotically-inducible protein OsmY